LQPAVRWVLATSRTERLKIVGSWLTEAQCREVALAFLGKRAPGCAQARLIRMKEGRLSGTLIPVLEEVVGAGLPRH
jgi:hypothetical protein